MRSAGRGGKERRGGGGGGGGVGGGGKSVQGVVSMLFWLSYSLDILRLVLIHKLRYNQNSMLLTLNSRRKIEIDRKCQ